MILRASRLTCAKQIKTFLFHDKKVATWRQEYWSGTDLTNDKIMASIPLIWKQSFRPSFFSKMCLIITIICKKTNQQEWHLTLTFELAYEQALIHCSTSKSEDARVESAREVTHFQWHASLTGSSLTANLPVLQRRKAFTQSTLEGIE